MQRDHDKKIADAILDILSKRQELCQEVDALFLKVDTEMAAGKTKAELMPLLRDAYLLSEANKMSVIAQITLQWVYSDSDKGVLEYLTEDDKVKATIEHTINTLMKLQKV